MFGFGKFGKKNKEFKEETTQSGFGETVHVLKDLITGDEKIRIKDYNAASYIDTGEQWCPECHVEMSCLGDYYECPCCGNEITLDDIACGYGCPSEEASYEDDFGPEDNTYEEWSIFDEIEYD